MDDVLSGQAAYVFWMAVVDAALLSWIAVRWYGRSMRLLMNGPASRDAAPPEPDAAPAIPAAAPARASLLVGLFTPSADGKSATMHRASVPARRRLVAAYCAGAAAFALVVTWIQFAAEQVSVIGWVSRAWTNAWPVVPALVVLLALNWREALRLLLAYLGLGAGLVIVLTVALQLGRGTLNAAPLTNVYWFVVGLAVMAAIPAALVLVSGWRRLRAVMPLALAATLFFGLGLALFRHGIVQGFEVAALRRFILASPYYLVYFLAALPIGWLAWTALRWIAAGYRGKAFSDAQLVVDCLWIIVAADHLVTALVEPHRTRSVLGVVMALVAYRAVVSVVLRRASARPATPRRRLLLLRVFGYQARTEALFDRIAQQWRFLGPVQLIAGTDLAARGIDPGDVLAFIGGRLAEQYVATPAELPGRVAALDVEPDPDGRFRVNELFCHADTWRPALRALLDVTDAVLMDLRSFSPRSAGCRFELEQLARYIPAERVVLVYDATTDLRLLGDVLGAAWAAPDAGDALVGRGGPISMVRIERRSGYELDALIDRLVGIGAPRQVVSAADLAAATA